MMYNLWMRTLYKSVIVCFFRYSRAKFGIIFAASYDYHLTNIFNLLQQLFILFFFFMFYNENGNV